MHIPLDWSSNSLSQLFRQTSPTLFPPSHHARWYTLDAYHRAGSRILSRSFTVTRWTDDDKVEENKADDGEVVGSDVDEVEDSHPNTSIESTMHIDDDHPHPPLLEDSKEGPESDSEDEDEDDPSDVAMVPMADLLNARWGSENVSSLFLCKFCVLLFSFVKCHLVAS